MLSPELELTPQQRAAITTKQRHGAALARQTKALKVVKWAVKISPSNFANNPELASRAGKISRPPSLNELYEKKGRCSS